MLTYIIEYCSISKTYLMKQIIVFAALLLGSFYGDAQTIIESRKLPENLVGKDDSLHKIALPFEKRVGDALKRTSARVKCAVTLDTVKVGKEQWLRLTYKAVLISCDPGNAQKFFTRRGGLNSSADKRASYVGAEDNCRSQALPVEAQVKKLYGKYKEIPLSDWLDWRGKRWTIQERFITEK